ncbi:MAG: hypothetical protein CME63_03250 [Halobacteriovoraceae bacterium]|nr:hypothetical protein [Halobacteriovoraceae bacterium]
MKLLGALLYFSIFINSALAEFSFLHRSPEALMMGDAFTAVADDENTLFYNPAALGRNRGLSIVPLKPNIAVPDVLDKELSLDNPGVGISDRFEDFPSDAEGIADRVLGYPLYLEVAAAPSIKLLNFGFNFFAVSKTSMDLQNAIHPVLNIDYRLDRGFITGYAFNFGNGGQGRNPAGHRSTIGIGLKTMNRQGLTGTFDLFGTELLDIIQDSDDYKSVRKNLGYSKGSGFGFDLGFEHNIFMGPTRLTFGAAWLDIGNTSFDKDEGDFAIPDQEQSLNLGASFNQDLGLLDYTLAIDYSNALDVQSATASKVKLGARARLPFIDLYTGYNGGYASWGLGIKAFFVDLKLGFYGIELGRRFRQREGKRTVLTISLAEINFDAF